MKITERLGKTKWDTAIRNDTKLGTYLLPIKAAVRKMEKITLASILKIEILI